MNPLGTWFSYLQLQDEQVVLFFFSLIQNKLFKLYVSSEYNRILVESVFGGALFVNLVHLHILICSDEWE